MSSSRSLRPAGESVATSPNLKGLSLPFRPELTNSSPSEFGSVSISDDSSRALLGVTRISVNGQPYVVALAASLSNVRAIQSRLLVTLLLSTPVAILLSLVGGAILTSQSIEPLDRMTSTAQQISAAHLNERIQLQRPDIELKRLADSFNEMLDRLDQSFKQIRQFTADASHELRTPVSILMGETELALNNLLDYEECKAALSSRREELLRMTRIIDDLLARSQFDYGERTLQSKPLDLSDLVIEVCEQQRNQARVKGVELELTKTVPVTLDGDSSRLRQMLKNILDNAIKYTPTGGKVTVELDRSNGSRCVLRVADTGIGIPDDSLSHIFDRFYRVDKARTREEGGSGLGLSIVKEIAEAHGGRVGVQSEMGAGTVLTIVFNEGLSNAPI